MCKCKEKRLAPEIPMQVLGGTVDPMQRLVRVRYTYASNRQIIGGASGLMYARGKILQSGDTVDIQYRDYAAKKNVFEFIGYVDELDAEKVIDAALGVTPEVTVEERDPITRPTVIRSSGRPRLVDAPANYAISTESITPPVVFDDDKADVGEIDALLDSSEKATDV